MHKHMIKGAAFSLLASALFAATAHADGGITFAGWGGALQDAERKAYLEPAAKALNIAIREDNMNGLAAVRAQVMSGKPKWDLVELGITDCVQAEKEGLSEPLDKSLIDTRDIDPAVVGNNWIASHAYASVVAWAKDTGKPVAQTWQAFFDPNVKGARAMYTKPWQTLEAALSGDAGLARQLLDAGARLRLPAAVALDRSHDVDRLLAQEPDALRPGARWGRLIVRAAESSSAAVIATLLAHGASVHARDDSRTAVDSTHGYTPLHAAAFAGNLGAVRELLRHGASPSERDDKWWGTPAGWASSRAARSPPDMRPPAAIRRRRRSEPQAARD